MRAVLQMMLSTLVVALTLQTASAQATQPSRVSVERTESGYRLIRNGSPFFIQGAGGGASKKLLLEVGGNSFRTWDAARIDAQLDEAQRLGLAVTVGLWLGHERRGFDYSDAQMVARQKERCRQLVTRYKDHPALLVWGVGNEVEGEGAGDNPAIWRAINDIAAMIKEVDPNHPTMSVMVELGGARVKSVHDLCPAIDIVGINSYGGASSVPARYRKAGGTKPYILTEFGPPGVWEVRDKRFGAPVEPTSAQKREQYRDAWARGVLAERDRLCLGGYAFTWNTKQEATATWYGLITREGRRTPAVDALSEAWTGKPVPVPCPELESLTIESPAGAQCNPGDEVKATLKVRSSDAITVRWELHRDSGNYQTGGQAQPPTAQFPDAIVHGDAHGCTLRAPISGGVFRLYAFAFDEHNGAAIGNVILKVSGPVLLDPAPKPRLPLVVFRGDLDDLPFAMSGFMGNFKALRVDTVAGADAREGRPVLRFDYNASSGWVGVSWQDPANDWGDLPGGLNLSGAKTLSFWARGRQGGERFRFAFGGIGRDKTYHDTARGELEVELSAQWKRYSIDLSGLDLSRVKTPFAWFTVKATSPRTFFLDDVRFE